MPKIAVERTIGKTKRAVLANAAESSFPEGLPEIITNVADRVSRTCSVDRDQLIGIVIAGLMIRHKTRP